MLLVVYRSIITMILMLMTVMVELSAARGVVAILANSGIISLSTYTTNLLTLLAIAAGADYAIFVVGRYQEARSAGEDREAAYYTMFRGAVHVIVGSGLTIAGAVACLSFTRLPYFQSLGMPAALGVLVALAAALTLGPRCCVMASHFGLLEPKRATRTRGWRRIGTVIVRWPGPDSGRVDRAGPDRPARAARLQDQFRRPPVRARHGAGGRRVHRGRTPLLPGAAQPRAADDRIRSRHAQPRGHDPARAGGQGRSAHPRHRPGAVDHPAPGHADHPQLHTVSDQREQRQHDHEPAATSRPGPRTSSNRSTRPPTSIDILQQQLALQQASAAATDEQTKAFHDTVDTINQLRDNLANFDDFFRPLRNYFYWEPHCFDIPSCAAMRSVFDSLDGIDQLADKFGTITASLDKLNALQPQSGGADPAAARRSGSQPRPAPLELRHHRRHRCAVRGGAEDRDRAGQGVRRRQERRLLLPAAGSLRQPRLPARPETVHVTGRPRRPHDHHPRGQSRHAGGHLAHRRRSGTRPSTHSRPPRWPTPRSTSPEPRRPTRTFRRARRTT